MAYEKNNTGSSGSAKGSRSGRVLKTGAVLAAVGLTALAVAKGLKTRRGRALKKKVAAKGRKVVRQVKGAARSATKRGTRKTASRAR